MHAGQGSGGSMRTMLQVFSVCLLVTAIPVAWANGGGGMSMPQPMPTPREETPQQKAHDAYNDGVRYVKKADKAQGNVQEAVQLDDTLPEAWNYVGYSNRKLGNYDAALAAYEKALTLKPGYADAIEYRGEAYLGLNRISDTQQAYLDLYASNRALAAKLLTAMKSWLAAQRANPSTAATGLDELDKWIQERAQIAGQTAALTRAGAAASWR
ncbi:MAG: tetratricopeptide repeat protein [Gammaproteobacteria bacterium]|nr:MAG: tetratricopeptide repeat protein [Gammaproteobacteria bacterium]